MNKIIDYLYHIPSSNDSILSADVFIIKGNNYNYIYDVGASTNLLNELNNIDKKIIFISHFHKDHTKNLSNLNYDKLYLSKYSSKHLNNIGDVINENFIIFDGIKIEVILISSPHSKGSIALNINNTYLLVGDAIYSKDENGHESYNVSLLYNLINDLEKINTKYIIISHKKNVIYKKNNILEYLKNIYKLKNNKSAIIIL